jgi:hypothetical protein
MPERDIALPKRLWRLLCTRRMGSHCEEDGGERSITSY